MGKTGRRARKGLAEWMNVPSEQGGVKKLRVGTGVVTQREDRTKKAREMTSVQKNILRETDGVKKEPGQNIEEPSQGGRKKTE